MRAWALALLASGCGFSGPDGNSLPDGATCLGTFVSVCTAPPPDAVTLTNGMIDTSDGAPSSRCLPATAYTTTPAVDACVIAGQSITIPMNNTISVTGTRRLILLASASVTIAGVLDAASHRGGSSGPAADTGPCPTNFTDPTVNGQGGGGWGGTFGGPGNNGGTTGGQGGIAGSALTITELGGGCPGGAGAGATAGSGGRGGGAVLLLAGQSISIPGTVNASGAGGSGGKVSAASSGGGGGGGGAGGMIVLDARNVTIAGRCFANGGGGGAGSSLIAGRSGGDPGAPDAAGGGGNNDAAWVGGDGGDGGLGTHGPQPGNNGRSITSPVVDAGGGGAGGGGIGIIKILAPNEQSFSDPHKVSPPKT
jgi:hypothetical protein